MARPGGERDVAASALDACKEQRARARGARATLQFVATERGAARRGEVRVHRGKARTSSSSSSSSSSPPASKSAMPGALTAPSSCER